VYGSDVGVENNAVQIDAGYAWFDVTKIDPSRERTFEEAKEDILARWRAEEARKALDAKVDEALKQLRDGSLKLADFATRENIQVQTAEKLDRTGGVLGAAAAAQIFAAPQNGFGSAPSSDDGRVVFQVTAIDAPAFDANAEETKQFAERISANMENDLATQYVAQLQSSLGANVNSQALATALGIVADQP
jgi:peptidyl-prolyl cis-trans isomerase D